MRRFFLVVLFLFFGISLAYASNDSLTAQSNDEPLNSKPIKFGALTWESGEFTTALLRQIIEKGYGYPTETVAGAGVALETGLIQNDIQVIAEIWMGRSEVLDKGIKQGKVSLIGDTLKGGATQGWYIPAYTAKAHPELKNVQDLTNFAHLFQDPKDPSKGRFLNCPSGWTCEIFNSHLLHNFHLDHLYINQHPGTGAALDSEISAYLEQQKPILFYYWQPTGLMAKYDFVSLKFPPYDATCWTEMLNPHSQSSCVSGFPISKLAIGISTPFLQAYPDLADFMQKVQLEPQMLNRQILEMTENHRSGDAQALLFLQQYPTIWQQWLTPVVAQKLQAQLIHKQNTKGFFPHWSLENKINQWLNIFVGDYGDAFRHISFYLQNYVLNPTTHFFISIPPWLFILVVGLLVWHSTRRILFALSCSIGLFIVGVFGLWQATMQTVSLMLVAIGLTIILGIPLGILFARYRRVYKVILPLLDVMQTMPSFVYLIPVLMLFGLGEVPAVFACLIYAIVPLIRLTVLGITEIDPNLIETGKAFGSNRRQMLAWVILPLAKPQILVGINQTVMMALSMVVLASMIGASGLGQNILQAIQTLNVGEGLQAGGAIVILAIIVDRITQAYGKKGANIKQGDSYATN